MTLVRDINIKWPAWTAKISTIISTVIICYTIILNPQHSEFHKDLRLVIWGSSWKQWLPAI